LFVSKQRKQQLAIETKIPSRWVFVEACSAPSQRKLLIEAAHLAESSSTAHKLLKDSPLANLLQQLLTWFKSPARSKTNRLCKIMNHVCTLMLAGIVWLWVFLLGGMSVVSSLSLQVLQR
jgi:hypothetical protein